MASNWRGGGEFRSVRGGRKREQAPALQTLRGVGHFVVSGDDNWKDWIIRQALMKEAKALIEGGKEIRSEAKSVP